MLYRAATVYDAARDVMRIYLSASAPGPDWRIGMMEFKYTDLLAQLEGGAALSSAARVHRADPLIEERTLP